MLLGGRECVSGVKKTLIKDEKKIGFQGSGGSSEWPQILAH